MNNEREDKEPDKQGSSKEASPGNTIVNIKNLEGNTSPDDVNTDTGGSSEGVDKTMVTAESRSHLGTLPETKNSPILDGLSPTNSAFNVRESVIKKSNLSTIDSVTTDTVDSSESTNTTMGTMTSSSSSGIPSVTKKSPIFDRLSPTGSAFYVPESEIRRSSSSKPGSDVWPSKGVIKYNSLMSMGISRRKKYFPTDSSLSPEDSGVDQANAETGSPTSSPQSSTPILPKMCPYDYSKIDNENTAGQRCLMTSGTRSDIHVIEESEEKVDEIEIPTEEREIVTYRSLDEGKGQEGIKETSGTSVSCSGMSSPHIHFLSIPRIERLNTDDSNEVKVSLMGIESDSATRILGEAFRQIIQTLEPRKQQQDEATTHESKTTDISTFENSAVDNYIKVKSGNDLSDSESSHSRYPVHSSGTGKQALDVVPATCRTHIPDYSKESLIKVHSKKSVYFADTVGLELTDIHTVSNSQSPPYIHQSVLDKLMPDFEKKPKEFSQKLLYPCFDQPGADFNFIKKVLSQKVCLENVLVSGMTIKGFVRVAKIAPYQSVFVRYSTDDWFSYNEVEATHMSENPDGMTERFSFTLEAPRNMQPASYLELVVLLISNSTEYADYNDGSNYKLQCVQNVSGLLAS